jgi:hypothetical protein
MIDDTLFYFGLMAIAWWSVKQVNKTKQVDLLEEEVDNDSSS